MSKFNQTQSNKITNLAGGAAFKLNYRDELIHAVLATFLENKFYEGGDERLNRIKELVEKCKCIPTFVAKLAIYARTQMHMRSVTTVLLGELAKQTSGLKSTLPNGLLRNAIINSIVRVDDITELVAYFGKDSLPNQVKRGLRRSLYKFNAYQLAKYKSAAKKVKLVDVFNLLHPNPKFATEAQAAAWNELINGKLKSTDTWESEISSIENTDKKEIWERLILENKLGYMATLRNLNNFIKHNLSVDAINKVISKLIDSNEIKKSKQLPFRFYNAYEAILDKSNRRFVDAVYLAMDIAVSNVTPLEGKTLIAVDTSGSMNGDPIKKAAIFAAALYKANNDCDLVLYSCDENTKQVVKSSNTPVIDVANDIMKEAIGGGTDTGDVFRLILANSKKYDNIIILSDNESWCSSAQEMYNVYKRILNVDPNVFAIDIAGYGTKDISSSKIIHICGWSDNILKFIHCSKDMPKLIEEINSIII